MKSCLVCVFCSYNWTDPDERAWYDSHRESILRGGDVDAEINTSMGPTVDQIMKFCSVSCFRGYGNDENGFFSVYSGLFAEILRQEEQAGLDIESLGLDTLDVDFGLSKHAWEETFLTRDRNGTSVKEFYAVMQSFSSTRSFRYVVLIFNLLDGWIDTNFQMPQTDARKGICRAKTRDSGIKHAMNTLLPFVILLRSSRNEILDSSNSRKKQMKGGKQVLLLRERQTRRNKKNELQLPDNLSSLLGLDQSIRLMKMICTQIVEAHQTVVLILVLMMDLL